LFARVTGANGCVAVSQVTLTVRQPVCVITNNLGIANGGSICIGQRIVFSGCAGASSYSWRIVAGNCPIEGASNMQTLALTGVTPGLVTVQLTAIVDGCTVISTFSFNVEAGPSLTPITLLVCPDASNNGTFNLTTESVRTAIGAAGMTVSFFTTEAAANANTGALTSTQAAAYVSGNNTFVFARVTNANGCTSVVRITLQVRTIVVIGRANCDQEIVSGSTTGRVAPQSGDAGSLNVIASPNPFSDRIRFNIQSDFSGQGTLEVFNTLGAKIKTVFQGPVVAGQSQTVDFAVPSAQRVNLIYVMTVGNRQTTGKLINMK
jgi:hypothetical protein